MQTALRLVQGPLLRGSNRYTRRKETPFSPFHIRLSAGDWLLLGRERRGLKLSEFPWWVRGSWFDTHCFGLIFEKSSLVWLASCWGRLLVGYPRGVTLTPGTCQGGKTGLVLGDFNFSFGLVFWHTSAGLTWVFRLVDELMWGWNTGRGWQLPHFGFVFFLMIYVESKLYVLLLEFSMFIA